MTAPTRDDPPRPSRQRLEELPFELNGTAPPVTGPGGADAAADDDTVLQRERRWAGLMRDATVQRAHQARAHAGAERLEDLLRAERAARGAASPPSPPVPARASWVDRLRSLMTPPVAAAFMLMFVVTAVLVGIWVPDDSADDERFRGVDTPTGAAPAPALRVLFRGDAREDQLRRLLLEQQLVVVAGPSTLGEYWLRRSDASVADLQPVAQALLDSGLATHAVVDERGGPGRH